MAQNIGDFRYLVLLFVLAFAGQNGIAQVEETQLLNTKALMKSIFNQDEKAAMSYLEQGVLIDGDDPDMNPLINAIYYKMPDLIGALIERGANIETQNKDGGTALMAAAYMGDKQTMTLLFDKKADPFKQNNKGYNSFDFSIFSENFDGVRHLLFCYLETQKEPTPSYLNELKSALLLQALLSEATDDYFKLFEQLEIRPEDSYFTNVSPLDIALMSGRDSLIYGLIERDFSVSKPDKIGKLPIQFVSSNCQKELYVFLLKKMLEEKAKTDDEKVFVTRLGMPDKKTRKLKRFSFGFQKLLMEYAIITGQKEMVVQLLKEGVDVNGQNNQGLYFLSIAV